MIWPSPAFELFTSREKDFLLSLTLIIGITTIAMAVADLKDYIEEKDKE